MSRPVATVIVVNWNGGRLLLDALTSLTTEVREYRTQTGRVAELVVVDNGSTDGSVQEASAAFPEARFIELPTNLGFAAAVNVGITASDAEYVILVNNDATVHPGYVNALVTAMDESDDLGAACGLVLLDGLFAPGPAQGAKAFRAHDGTQWHRTSSAKGIKLINSTGNIVSSSGNGADRDWLLPYRPVPATPSLPVDVFGFNGGSAILRREALREVGLLDESFFMYYEDTELSWRLRRAGWRIVCVLEAVTDHQHAASSVGDSAFFTFHNVRNRLLVATMHGSWPMIVRAWSRTLARAVRGPESPLTLRALRDAVARLPHTVRSRRRLSRQSHVPRRVLEASVAACPTSAFAPQDTSPGAWTPQPTEGSRAPSAGTRPVHVSMSVEQCWRDAPGGSGRYIVELSSALHTLPGVRVTGLSARHQTPASESFSLTIPVDQSMLPSHLLIRAWDHFQRPLVEHIHSAAIDVVHATTWTIPATRKPLVVTVHDLAFLHFPEYFTPRGLAYFKRALERTKAKADVIIVPSQATADDCLANGIDADRVKVIPLGLTTTTVTAEQCTSFRQRTGLPDRYLLWCGTHEPRKNLAGLLRAFVLVAREEPDLHLVLIGPPGWGEGPPEIDQETSDRVHSLGFVSDEDLHCAYTLADAFVFPSHWEGFGLPVLEAMGHGVPVVTSANSSMAEVVGPAGVLVDPDSPASIAAGIRTAIGPSRPALALQSLERSQMFTWNRTAQLTAQAYSDAASRAAHPR